MIWRVFYGDDATYSNEDGSPFDAPALNVQCIVHSDPEVGRTIRAKCDFYWLVGDSWHGGDIFGLWDYLTRPGAKKVIFGRSLAPDEYDAVLKAALTDPDFPPKSARREGEPL